MDAKLAGNALDLVAQALEEGAPGLAAAVRDVIGYLGTQAAADPLVVLVQRVGGAGELEKLVEAEECQRRIVAAGCEWREYSDGPRAGDGQTIVAIDRNGEANCCESWPAARDWAEAQAAAEEWKPPETISGCLDMLAGEVGLVWDVDVKLGSYNRVLRPLQDACRGVHAREEATHADD